MHAVDEINVCPARRSEQYTCTLRDAPRSVGRQVAQPEICLYLNNHSGGTMVKQDTTQEFARHLDRTALIEGQPHQACRFQQSPARPQVRGRPCWPMM